MICSILVSCRHRGIQSAGLRDGCIGAPDHHEQTAGSRCCRSTGAHLSRGRFLPPRRRLLSRSRDASSQFFLGARSALRPCISITRLRSNEAFPVDGDDGGMLQTRDSIRGVTVVPSQGEPADRFTCQQRACGGAPRRTGARRRTPRPRRARRANRVARALALRSATDAP